jgi:hypothetical protein
VKVFIEMAREQLQNRRQVVLKITSWSRLKASLNRTAEMGEPSKSEGFQFLSDGFGKEAECGGII